MAADPYAILEVQRDASDDEIKASRARLAKLCHPDRNPGFQEAANARVKQVNDAYDRIFAERRLRRAAADGAATLPNQG